MGELFIINKGNISASMDNEIVSNLLIILSSIPGVKRMFCMVIDI
jgi:hypothetical protein